MGGRAWTASDVQFVRANSPRMSYEEIASELGRTAHAVKNRAVGMGILRPDRPRAFTSAEDAYLRENFESLPIGEVAVRLGRHVESIRARSRILGLVNQTTAHHRAVRATVRHDYFSRIDAPVKAYVLGLLASDGAVNSVDNGVSLKMKLADADVVRFVRDELSPESKVGEYVLPPLPGYTTERHYAMFSISSAQMKADLARFGVTPRKTFTIWWPDIADEMTAAFTLGCFDGDGCLYRARTPRWDLYSASRSFLEDMQEAIKRQAGFRLTGPQSTKGGRLFCLRYSGRKVYDLDRWLHADVPGLARKRLATS